MRREWMVFALIGAYVLVMLLTAADYVPDPEPDAGAGGPPVFILGILFAIIAFALPRAKPVIGLDRPVRIWRRGVAFYIDVIIGVTIVGTVFWLVAKLVGLFVPYNSAFSFYGPDGQLIIEYLVAANLLVLVALSGIFWMHAKLERPTIGQYIMGYRIEYDPDPDNPSRRLLGMFAGLIAACSLHLWGWFVKYEDTQKGNYWWDRIGQTRAVFVGPY